MAQEHPDPDGDIQTPGRKENAAQPLDAGETHGGAERYPSTRADDGIERSFEPKTDAGSPASPQDGFLGPHGADPAEGKR